MLSAWIAVKASHDQNITIIEFPSFRSFTSEDLPLEKTECIRGQLPCVFLRAIVVRQRCSVDASLLSRNPDHLIHSLT